MWPLLTACLVLPAEPSSCVPPHVRGASPMMRTLLEEATVTSPTVNALVTELQRSDTIVYLEFTAVPDIRRARTKLVAASGDVRFLRISISVLVPAMERLPLLAHELQHATEIARERRVRDDDGMRRLYRRIGMPGWRDTYETAAAGDVERRARAEQFARRSRR